MTALPRKWNDAVAKFSEDTLNAIWHCALVGANNAYIDLQRLLKKKQQARF